MAARPVPTVARPDIDTDPGPAAPTPIAPAPSGFRRTRGERDERERERSRSHRQYRKLAHRFDSSLTDRAPFPPKRRSSSYARDYSRHFRLGDVSLGLCANQGLKGDLRGLNGTECAA